MDTTKLVVIKRYDDEAAAYIDAELLRSEGIECRVDGAADPLSPVMKGVALKVEEHDAQRARGIVPDSSTEG